jgi:hypothetical protein
LDTKHDQLTDVICVVVDDQKGFAQEGLSVAVGEFGVEIVGGIRDERPEFFEILVESGYGFVQSGIVGRGGFGGPVAFGPFRGDVAGVAREFEDVVLGDSQVLQELPGCMGGTSRLFAAEGGRQVLHGVIEGGVGVAAIQGFEEVLA